MGHHKGIMFFFKNLPFSSISFFKGMSMLLERRQLLQASSFSSTIAIFFKMQELQIESNSFSRDIFFKIGPWQPFSRLFWDGWWTKKTWSFLKDQCFWLPYPSLLIVSKKWSNTLYLGASLALILVETTPGLTEEATIEILPTVSSDENVQCVLGFKKLEFQQGAEMCETSSQC